MTTLLCVSACPGLAVEDVLLQQRVERLHGGVVAGSGPSAIDPVSFVALSSARKARERIDWVVAVNH